MLIPLTGTFPGWPVAPQPSVAHWLFVVIGIPVICMAVVGVLAGAGALARRGRGAPAVGESVWYGQTGEAVPAAGERAQLTAGPSAEAEESVQEQSGTGGASVRW